MRILPRPTPSLNKVKKNDATENIQEKKRAVQGRRHEFQRFEFQTLELDYPGNLLL